MYRAQVEEHEKKACSGCYGSYSKRLSTRLFKRYYLPGAMEACLPTIPELLFFGALGACPVGAYAVPGGQQPEPFLVCGWCFACYWGAGRQAGVRLVMSLRPAAGFDG